MRIMTQDELLEAIKDGQYEYNKILFKEVNLTNRNIQTIWFTECKFINSTIEESVLDNTAFIKCMFEKVSYLKQKMDTICFSECIFTECNFGEVFIEGDQTGWADCRFIRCKFDEFKVIYGGLEMMGCSFETCNLKGLSIRGSEIGNVKFIDSDLSNGEIIGSSIVHCTFKNSNLTNTTLDKVYNDTVIE